MDLSLSLHKQRGVATLLFSVTILFLVSLVSVYTSRAIIFDQKIANNDVRQKHAFEAAEAGMSSAKAYLRSGADQDDDGVPDPVFDTDADGVGDALTATLGGGHTTTVTITDMSGGSMNELRIDSQGVSDDASAQVNVSTVVTKLDPLPNAPGSPLTTRGSVVINGSATVHNPQGHSTIWSGGDIDLGSNNSTATNIADPVDANYPTCMETPMTCSTVKSSNKVIIGLDAIEHDSSLSNMNGDEFFTNFFGISPESFRDSLVTIDTSGANAALDAHLATNEVIWADGNASLSGVTVGCTSAVTGNNTCPVGDQKPSILVVDGDLTISGTPHFYGAVFVTGDINLSGNSTFHGVLIVSGDNNVGGGSLDVWYNTDIIDSLRSIGPLSVPAGGWKDF